MIMALARLDSDVMPTMSISVSDGIWRKLLLLQCCPKKNNFAGGHIVVLSYGIN